MKSRITLIIILNALLSLNQTKATLRVIYSRVEAMEVSKESKVQVLSCHIVPYNNSYFQGEIEILQDVVSSKVKIVIEVFRCLVGEAPDTCEFLIKLKPANACLLINAENTAWNAITDAFTPKLRCPLKKGKYVADKITFDANKWNIFPLDNFHFKVNSKIYEGDLLSLGLITQARFIRVH